MIDSLPWALQVVLSPRQFAAYVEDEGISVSHAVFVAAVGAVLFAMTTGIAVYLTATKEVADGVGFIELRPQGVWLLAIATLFVSFVGVFVSAVVYQLIAWVLRGLDATYAQALRLAAAQLCVSAVAMAPGLFVQPENPPVGDPLLVAGILYVIWVTGRGLIYGMGTSPAATAVIGILLALGTIAIPPASESRRKRARQERVYAESKAKTERRELEKRTREEAIARRRAEKEHEAGFGDRVQALREAKKDLLDVQVVSFPSNAEVFVKGEPDPRGRTPMKLSLPEERFPVLLQLKAEDGRATDYEVSSLQSAITVIFPDAPTGEGDAAVTE